MNTDNLKKMRQCFGWTQKNAAGKLGIATATYRSYEQGQREPNNEMLCKLADLYEVTTDYLLGREVSDDPPSVDAFIAACRAMNEPEFDTFYRLFMQFAYYCERGLLGYQDTPHDPPSKNGNVNISGNTVGGDMSVEL